MAVADRPVSGKRCAELSAALISSLMPDRLPPHVAAPARKVAGVLEEPQPVPV
ncbi:hypothetical protein [Streptomyces uncialis]|uniref:hypothetical protein n=1 Tax=Streptomyces uncialis TaxID=1048205 RepID=UPI002F95B0A7|nr:hypothetical protein OG924_37015 [Streptomyces uncialis]